MSVRRSARRVLRLGLMCSCVLLGVLSSAPALADAGADRAYADAVLDALARKGLLTPAEVREIRQQAGQAAARHGAGAESSATAVAPAARPAQQDTVAAPREWPEFRVWGRLQPRYTYIPGSDGLEAENAFTLRRARMGVQGDITEDIAFRTQYEAANEVPGLSNADSLLDAWIRLEHFEAVGDLVVGQQFVPGYGRPPQWSASVERKFTEFLSPGVAGRARGLTLRRGRFSMPEPQTEGWFGDRLYLHAGVFNSPDLGLDNDDSQLLYSLALGLAPLGPTFPDEYAWKPRPLRYMLGIGLNRSQDSDTFDTRVQAALLGQDVELDNDWYHLFAELQGGRWFGWTSYAEFHSRPRGSADLLMDAGGALRERLRSRAFTAGLSHTLAWPGEGRALGLGLQYQRVDNEHPSRTRFFRVLTGRSPQDLARGMDHGQAWHAMLTYIFSPYARLINEYIWFDRRRDAYSAWITQMQIDF